MQKNEIENSDNFEDNCKQPLIRKISIYLTKM
jgi:hypothetical protein